MIIIVGPFPPPVHGASLVTQRVAERLIADKLPVLLCNTSPGNSSRRLEYHLSRLLAYIRCGRAVLHCDQKTIGPTAVYISLSGGLGLLYDLIIIALARLKRHEVIFHHHSFSYLTKRSALMRAIIHVAGKDQLHILLCPIMAKWLTKLYNPLLRTEVISNLAFMDAVKFNERKSSHGLDVIGYLSNISLEKGIDRFLDLMTKLRAKGSRVTGRIAGPFVGDEIKHYVERRIREIGGVEYVGPVFGDAKAQFLSSIDLLVFPTRYLHEAQPLVVYEAQAAGAVVSASDRGCISQMIPAELLLDSVGSNINILVEKMLTWESSPELFLRILQKCQNNRVELTDQQLTDSGRFRDIFSLYK
jgi:glycosyltransferase involved in cell wall biosynthesis